MKKLIKQLEELTEDSRQKLHTDACIEIGNIVGTTEMPVEDVIGAPPYTTSIDAAMTLLPETYCNFELFDFIGHGKENYPKKAWGCRIMDTEQIMGKKAAKEEIARLKKTYNFGKEIRGPVMVQMEKAIAEHFIEFYCICAATPALAICIAALKVRNDSE